MQSSLAIQMLTGAEPDPRAEQLIKLRAFVVRLCMQLQLLNAESSVVKQALAYLKEIGLDSEGISAEQEEKLRQFLASEPEAPRRDTDPPEVSFTARRATIWPDPAKVKFTTDRGENDPHNMQNRAAPLKRRSTDIS